MRYFGYFEVVWQSPCWVYFQEAQSARCLAEPTNANKFGICILDLKILVFSFQVIRASVISNTISKLTTDVIKQYGSFGS